MDRGTFGFTASNCELLFTGCFEYSRGMEGTKTTIPGDRSLHQGHSKSDRFPRTSTYYIVSHD